MERTEPQKKRSAGWSSSLRTIPRFSKYMERARTNCQQIDTCGYWPHQSRHMSPQNCLDGLNQNFIAERFPQKCVGACLQCLGTNFGFVPSCHKDDRRCTTSL